MLCKTGLPTRVGALPHQRSLAPLQPLPLPAHCFRKLPSIKHAPRRSEGADGPAGSVDGLLCRSAAVPPYPGSTAQPAREGGINWKKGFWTFLGALAILGSIGGAVAALMGWVSSTYALALPMVLPIISLVASLKREGLIAEVGHASHLRVSDLGLLWWQRLERNDISTISEINGESASARWTPLHAMLVAWEAWCAPGPAQPHLEPAQTGFSQPLLHVQPFCTCRITGCSTTACPAPWRATCRGCWPRQGRPWRTCAGSCVPRRALPTNWATSSSG